MKPLKSRPPDGLNNPSRWHNNLRPHLDTAYWQDQIDTRIGLNKRGQSIVRLVWGQDVWVDVWGESTPRYWLRRARVNGKFTYWTVPRWIFESRLEPEQYVDSWNATRYSLRDPTAGGSPRCDDCGYDDQPVLIGDQVHCRRCRGTNVSGGLVVDKGPPPAEYFTYTMDCSTHQGPVSDTGWYACCTEAFYSPTKFGSAGARCWGEYRPPGALELATLDRMATNLAIGKFTDNYTPLTTTQLAEIELNANKQMDRAEEQMEAHEQEMMADFYKRHGWRIRETDPGALKSGYFHDFGATVAKAEKSAIILTD